MSARNYAEASRGRALLLRSQYLALIVKKITLQNAIFSVKVAESSLALDEEKLRGGALSPGDVIPSRLAVEEARLAKDRAEEDMNFSRNAIIRLAGLDGLPDSEIPDGIPMDKLKLDQGGTGAMLAKFQHDGVENTNLALMYYWGIKQAELNYKQAKYRLFPKLSAGASVAQSNSTNAAGDVVVQTGVYSQSVSLTVGWSIFDGFATRAAKMSSMASRRIAERALANYIEQTTEQARTQERQLAFAVRAMDLANVRRELIVGALERAEDDLKRGFGSQGAVDTIQLSLNNYTLVANANRADFLNRASDFISLVGSDPVLEKLPARFNAPVSRKK
jgi:outer membrane protein TolC